MSATTELMLYLGAVATWRVVHVVRKVRREARRRQGGTAPAAMAEDMFILAPGSWHHEAPWGDVDAGALDGIHPGGRHSGGTGRRPAAAAVTRYGREHAADQHR